jgi:hypothetical protein
MRFVAGAACAYLVICFLYAAFLKSLRFGQFSASVAAIAPSLARCSSALAGAVIAAEAGTAAFLIGSVVDDSAALRQAAAIASLGLALIFACAVASVLWLDRQVACNCFGEDEMPISASSMIGPAMILLASALLLTSGAWQQAIGFWLLAGAAGLYLLLIHRALLLFARRSGDRS